MDRLMKIWHATPELFKPLLALTVIVALGLIAFFFGRIIGTIIYQA